MRFIDALLDLHLTSADVVKQLDEFDGEFIDRHGTQLPVRGKATAVVLIEKYVGEMGGAGGV
jgi:hypothetical protein